MTREEKVNLLNELLEIEEKNDIGNLTRADRREFQEWAIQALEQEPCDDMTIAYLMGYYADKEPCADSVSRQAVIDLVDKFIIPIPTMGGRDLNAETNSHLRQVKRNIEQLPSVRPQEQTGHWEEIVEEHKCYARDDTYTTTEYHCSECGAEPFENEDGFYELSNYCPSCGAKMFEPQESEDKNEK